uniref:Ribosomal L1 domain-containing protein 1 n=1 Tax=Magallana gigas TaxID=29159 RepID=A0A8W8KHC7_MAGGI
METKALDIPKAELAKAVDGLQKLLKVSNAKSDILQEREKIHLQVSMKKIPNLPEQIIKVNLPHGLYTADTDVCLFVKDLDKKSREFEVSEEHFSDMLVEKGVNCVRKVIPLKALKLEYKPFEAKRNLSNEFDLFLADSRIIRLLPSLLGKSFYGRKRNPIQVDLEAKDLKEEISKAVNNTRCILKNRGSSCLVTVGYSDMTRDQIVENVLKTVEQLSLKFPGGSNNIRSLHIKTTSSASIPFFVSLDSGETVVFPERKKEKNKPVIGEITTVMDKKEESTVGVEAVEVKIEYDSQGEVDEEPAQKKVKKTPKKDSAVTPKAVEKKTPKKSPKSATMEKAAKKLKEITPPTVKRLQSKARVLTPDKPSGKKKKN